MDENMSFAVLLVVAFVIIGILMVFGAPLAQWGGEPSGNYQSLASFPSIGDVGFSEQNVERSVDFGSFVLGRPQTENLNIGGSKSLPNLRVSSAAWFGITQPDTKSFNINVGQHILNDLRSVKISFDTGETNLLASLVIKWNGKEVFNKLANLNHYDVSVDKDNVRGTNTLEISAENPGFQFWATNTYNLRNFKVTAEYGDEKFFSFDIYPNEMEAWHQGTLRFYTTSSQTGVITIKLNGHQIYREQNPTHLVSVQLNYSDIAHIAKIGDNILAMKADNVFQIDNLNLDIVLSTTRAERTREFNVTEEDYNLLGRAKGEIAFTVDKVLKEGKLNIELNGNDLYSGSPQSGENKVEFTYTEASKGMNTLKFSGTGGWDISEVEVGIIY
jgi:hypothetical protein